MASASSTSAKSLFVDSKLRLAERVKLNLNNISSLARQISRDSKSTEIIMHSARNFAFQEHLVDNSLANLNKLNKVSGVMIHQHETFLKSSQQIEEIKEQVCAMQR